MFKRKFIKTQQSIRFQAVHYFYLVDAMVHFNGVGMTQKNELANASRENVI